MSYMFNLISVVETVILGSVLFRIQHYNTHTIFMWHVYFAYI